MSDSLSPPPQKIETFESTELVSLSNVLFLVINTDSHFFPHSCMLL